MTRVVSLFLPTWPTDRWRRKAGNIAPPVEAPLVLVGRTGRRRTITAVDANAQALGVGIGMAVAKAQVRMPSGPLKTVGEHTVSVSPHHDVVVEITVQVVAQAE